MRWLAWLAVVAACTRHDDVQHPAAPVRLDTPGPVAAAPPKPAARVAIDWDKDLAYLPVDSELVAGIDLAQLRSSDLGTRYAPLVLAKLHDQLGDVKERCGFDPAAMLAGMSFGVKDLGAGAARGAFVLHGLARGQVSACLANAPGARTEGDVFIVHSIEGDVVATFLDDTTLLVVGGQGVARADLDAARAGQSALPTSPTFLDLWKLVDKHGSGWVLVNGNTPSLASVKSIAPDLKAIVASITLTDRLAIDGRLRMGSAQTVATLTGIITGQLAQAKQFFDRLDVTADSTDVHLEVAMTADQLDQLAAMLQTPLVHRDAKGH